jgi:serine/threonine kinase 32
MIYALKKTSIVNILSQSGEEKMKINILKNELLALQRIESYPFIVGLKYAFHDFKECFLVLDFISGSDLRKILDRKYLIGEFTLALIGYSIGSALEFIHERRILHRDIKPENILLGCLFNRFWSQLCGGRYQTNFCLAHL